eukprot:m.319293 g.319293  ORF g.319293 m.319293 type:complete len:51 (-) comp20301_c0_seq6:2446-2598(-)
MFCNILFSQTGYGFVRFGDEHEAEMACMEMTGKIGLGGKPIRVNKATPLF